MKLDLLEIRTQNMIQKIRTAAQTAEFIANSMGAKNDIDVASLIGVSAQGRKILDECERLKAICDALTYEEKEEDNDEE